VETREPFPQDGAPQTGELFPENKTNGTAATPDFPKKLSQPNEEDVHTS
jgi:hypothetical protein